MTILRFANGDVQIVDELDDIVETAFEAYADGELVAFEWYVDGVRTHMFQRARSTPYGDRVFVEVPFVPLSSRVA